MFIAAALSICTVVLFKLDGDIRLLNYNSNMREASCKILSKHLQHIEVPQGPPEIDLPPEEKWRGEIAVEVDPGDGSQPFDANVHDTVQGAYDDAEDFQIHWLEAYSKGDVRTCYFGPVDGHSTVTFDLQTALTSPKPLYSPHSSYGMGVAKIVVAFFALVFSGLVILKLVAGSWEMPSLRSEQGEEHEERPMLREERRGGTVQGQPPRYVVDLQGERPLTAGAALDLRAGTPRSAEDDKDSLEDVSLGRRP